MNFSNVLKPDRYHGFSAKPPFFEGWYYKLVSEDEATRFAIIPGVYLSPNPAESHSFVQVFDSEAQVVRYHTYPLEAFKAAKDSFTVGVGPNTFTANRIELAIADSLGSLEGVLDFEQLNPWPVRLVSPGAMGWFAWVPLMECYHGVVSMDHIIEGTLTLDGQATDFSGGRGYIEKDWGRRFPLAWIWGQSNHFEKEGVSLMMSVAVIPWLGKYFGGFIIGFLHDGRLHRFATYNGSKIEALILRDHDVEVTVVNREYRLRVNALRSGGGLLQAPTHSAMDRRIIETLNASIHVVFEDLKGTVLFQGTGQHAGLETEGDLGNLVKMIL